MKYNVHVYAVVRVKVEDVEAESQEAAIQKVLASDTPDLYTMFDDVSTEYAEDIVNFLVDEVGDEEYANTNLYDGEGNLVKNTKGDNA